MAFPCGHFVPRRLINSQFRALLEKFPQLPTAYWSGLLLMLVVLALYSFILNWGILALQYCVDFCHTSTWISHRYYVCPLPLDLPSYPLPYPIPLGYHRAPDLSSLHQTVNFHWYLILHMIMYMFQFYSLSLSHPLLPPLCPQVSSLCLCLLCCPANRFISTIFLDSIYMCWMASPTQWTWVWASSRSWWWTGKPGVLQSMGSQRVGHDWVTELNWIRYLSFSFWLTSLCIIGSRFIHSIRTELYVFLFMANIPLCIHTTTSLSIHLSVDI